jgi:purine-cytosine permease-like protein
LPIERRSITFIPEDERHGRVIDQGPFWFLSNFHFFAIAIIAGRAGGTPAPAGGFNWVAFVTQLASAVSFNVTAAPYVSDYSRYLPTKTPRVTIIVNVFLGSALSAIWLIALGA